MSRAILCPSCGEAVDVEDLNLERLLARCHGCNKVFSWADQVPPTSARPLVARPATIEVREGTGRLTLVRRWRRRALLWPTAIGLAFGAGVGAMVLASARDPHAPAPVAVVAVFTAVVACGLYGIAAGWINRTWVDVSGGFLTVRHGPLPWPGQSRVEVAEVEQVYVVQRFGDPARFPEGFSHLGGSYDLCAVLKNGQQARLDRGLADSQEAVFLQRRLVQHLDIGDRNVAGQFDG